MATDDGPTRALQGSFSFSHNRVNQLLADQSTTTKRRYSMGEPLVSPEPSSSPWCTRPSEYQSRALTSHQQTICSQLTSSAPHHNDSSSSFVALVGPRGCGKSTIAAHLAQQAPVLWLQAHSETTLRASYIAILRQYMPQEKTLGQFTTMQLAERISQTVLTQQQAPCPISVVYDDVAVSPSVFFSQWAIPSASDSASTQIIITTTISSYQTWKQDNFNAVEVQSKLSTQQAKAFLTASNNPLSESVGDEIVQTLLSLLHANPLALTIASAQCRRLKLTLPYYLQHLQSHRVEIPSSKDDPSVDWFWYWTVDQLCQQPEHASALKVLASVHHECIPEALLKPYQSVIKQLGMWRILQKDLHLATYSIPVGIQHAIRKRFGLALALTEAMKAMKTCLSSKQKNALSLLPHMETLQSNFGEVGNEHNLPAEFRRETYADVLLQMGVTLQRPPLADYTRAHQSYCQGLQVLSSSTETIKKETSPVAKSLYYRLGTCARLQGDHRQAKVYSAQALELYGYHNLSRQSTDQPPILHQNNENTTSGEWNILSQLFHTCGHASWQDRDVLDARLYFEHELAVKQAWYGDTPNDRIARTLNNLGSVCRDAGDLMAARDYSLKALQMQQELGMGDNLETATVLNNLGSLSYSLCKYSQAQEFLEQAIEMKQKCYQHQQSTEEPVQNLDVGETYYNLGMLADHLSNYPKAQEYYQHSLSCKQSVFGKEAKNAQIATSLSSLALSAMNHGHYGESEEYYTQALEMQRDFYHNVANMEVVRTLHGLGILNYHLGKLQQSRRYHREALEMQQKFEAKERHDHPQKIQLSDPRTVNLSQIMQNLGNLAHNLGEYDNAREFYEQGLKLYSQVSVDSTKDDHLQRMLSNLQDLSSENSYDAARAYYEKALEMKFFVYGEDSANSDLAFTLRSLAMLNDNAGRHEEAQECYEKALSMLHHFYGSNDAANAEIAGVLDGLGTVNFNMGKYEESQRWLQGALAMKETVYGDTSKNNDLATSHVGLGMLFHTLGNYEDAKIHLETAFEVQKEVFGSTGEQNIELGVTTNCLANLFRDLGETERALELYEEAVRFMGKDNPYQASLLVDKGEYHRQQGEYEKANSCLQEAGRLQNKLYGDDTETAEAATLSIYLGKLYIDLGRYDEAQECLESALRVQRKVLGNRRDDGEMANTLQALGHLMHVKSDPESARAHLEEARSIRQSTYGNVKTLEMAETMQSLSLVYAELHDDEKAGLCQQELSEMRTAAPEVSKALDRTLHIRQHSAAVKLAEALQSADKDSQPSPPQLDVPPADLAVNSSNGPEQVSQDNIETKMPVPTGEDDSIRRAVVSSADEGHLEDENAELSSNIGAKSVPEGDDPTAAPPKTFRDGQLKATGREKPPFISGEGLCSTTESQQREVRVEERVQAGKFTEEPTSRNEHNEQGNQSPTATDMTTSDAEINESAHGPKQTDPGERNSRNLTGTNSAETPQDGHTVAEAEAQRWTGARQSSVARLSGEQPHMDWTDRKLVKRESMRYVKQKKAREISAAKGRSKSPEAEKNDNRTNETNPKHEKRSKSKSRLHDDKAESKPKPKPEKRKSNANVHYVASKSKNENGKSKGDKRDENETKPKLEKRKSKAKIRTSEVVVQNQTKTRDASISSQEKIEASKSEFSARKAAQKWKRTVAERKEKDAGKARLNRLLLRDEEALQSNTTVCETASKDNPGLRRKKYARGRVDKKELESIDIDAGSENGATQEQSAVSIERNGTEAFVGDQEELGSKLKNQQRSKDHAAETRTASEADARTHRDDLDEQIGASQEAEFNTSSTSQELAESSNEEENRPIDEKVKTLEPVPTKEAYKTVQHVVEKTAPRKVGIEDKSAAIVEAACSPETDAASVDAAAFATPADAESSQQTSGEPSNQDHTARTDDKTEEMTGTEEVENQCPNPVDEDNCTINEQKREKERDEKPENTVRGGMSIDKELRPPSRKAISTRLKPRRVGSMGDVTDMPPREPQGVEVTCRWWPFRSHK